MKFCFAILFSHGSHCSGPSGRREAGCEGSGRIRPSPCLATARQSRRSRRRAAQGTGGGVGQYYRTRDPRFGVVWPGFGFEPQRSDCSWKKKRLLPRSRTPGSSFRLRLVGSVRGALLATHAPSARVQPAAVAAVSPSFATSASATEDGEGSFAMQCPRRG